MFNGKKVVILVWSPIGYEVYLSLCLMMGADNVILISARNFNPPEASSFLGLNHHYFTQTKDEINKVCCELRGSINQAIIPCGKFILFVPQMGNFYGRSLIESNFCESFFIYDEGSAAYGDHFVKKCKEVWMRKNLIPSESLIDFYSEFSINLKNMSEMYFEGVKFYDVNHSKLKGLVGFFPDAFPGFEKIQIPIAPFDDFNNADLSKDILVILPPVKQLIENHIYLKYIEDINELINRGFQNVLIKPHPADGNIPFEKYQALLGRGNSENYHNYIQSLGMSPYRETALMGFGSYLTSGNSTQIYIEQLQKMEGALIGAEIFKN